MKRYNHLDLLVVMPQVENKRLAMIELLRSLNRLPTSKDVVVTTQEEIQRHGQLVGDILFPALKEGKVVFERT